MRRTLRELLALRDRMLAVEAAILADRPPREVERRRSACNLAHYVALRTRDRRALQARLARAGLSSLGRAEGNVLATLDAVIRIAARSAGEREPSLQRSRGHVGPLGGRRILDARAARLFGPARPDRAERILVTLPPEAADDAAFVRGLVAAGMDLARINCAHDGPEAWARMVRHVRAAARAEGRPVRVLMDLGGPKLRTGPVVAGPEVVHWRPRRDELGRTVEPARIWLVPADAPTAPPEPARVTLPVAADWLARRRVGDVVSFVDARGSLRTLRVVARAGRGRWAVAAQSAWVVSGTRLESAPRHGEVSCDAGSVGRLPASEAPILLRPGDEIVLTRSLEPGAPEVRDATGRVVAPARIGCTLPEALDAARPGHAVWFDDGKIGGRVESASRDSVRVRIEHASPGGSRLRADKGINLPDSELRVAALTPRDAADLRFVVAHADAVALSFVRSRADVEDLLARLAALGRPDLAVVLKIETRQGFERLPEILLASMGADVQGVMIARGDLAVECGWERLAEVQEEILWFCEAAHVPVVWATQVLDAMARTGQPTRAEVTDAAMSVRAECVMLNKGPHVREAVVALDGILRRMEGHQRKKSSLLRRLHVAERFARAADARRPRARFAASGNSPDPGPARSAACTRSPAPLRSISVPTRRPPSPRPSARSPAGSSG